MKFAALVRASLIAPLTTPLLYCVGIYVAAAADPMRRPYLWQNFGRSVLVTFLFAGGFAYAATVAALILLWIVRRLGPLTIWHTVVVGAGVGFAVAALLRPTLPRDWFHVTLELWHGLALGGASAAVWWLLATRRPRRSEPRGTPLC